ncbi:hypothetical protein [Gaoshiqia sp. Z1-71]|uniref:hypothetical protein n=1 Tax=Gaoshiqia hydrogeniformans TaxID=3290090 RepID=UPI003BF9214A
MSGLNDIPLPVKFNAFKHHRKYILALLTTVSVDELAEMLNPLCHNYIDIYTGRLSPETIGNQIICFLKNEKAFHPDEFKTWLNATSGYRHIRLDDGSEWIIREGVEPERYIHVHPARTGSCTIRVKGSTLKTSLILKINHPDLLLPVSLHEVNRVRQLAGLPPVKKLERGKGIQNCIERFFAAC